MRNPEAENRGKSWRNCSKTIAKSRDQVCYVRKNYVDSQVSDYAYESFPQSASRSPKMTTQGKPCQNEAKCFG